MDSRFQKELEELKVKVLQMAAYTQRALEKALLALTERDADQAALVIDGDREINAMECEVDNLSLRLLALDQPVAMDLRFIVAAMRLVVDLERIGDEAVNIAEQVVLLAHMPPLEAGERLGEMAVQVESMLRMAITSFKSQDIELAKQVCMSDALADGLNMRVLKECLDLRIEQSGKGGLDRAVRGVLIARSMERVGDLATNIAESTIFVVRGVSIKHHCQPF